MRVLISTDGSNYSEAALRAVLQRPWPEGSQFRVLTVVERPAISYVNTGDIMLNYETMMDAVREPFQNIVDSAVARLRDAGLSASGLVRQGIVAEEIIDEAKEWAADLILVGTHGRRGVSRFLLGSVAQKVAAHASCSVEIVRLNSKEVQR